MSCTTRQKMENNICRVVLRLTRLCTIEIEKLADKIIPGLSQKRLQSRTNQNLEVIQTMCAMFTSGFILNVLTQKIL